MDYYYWSHGCSECASGRYSSVDGATGCKSCPSGTYAEAGRSTCTTCAAGSYAGSGASNCTACPTGYVSTGETGAVSLETACTLCEAGTYDAGTECVTCPAGTYSGDAATECTDCAAGTYSTATGATSCVACPGGTYQDAAGATDCVDCAADNDDDEPGHYSTYSDGAASQSECVCETGWAGELCTVTSCATVATISLGHMLLMANPLTRAYIGTTAAVDDTVTVTNDVRSALQEWDLDSNNILTYAEVTACLATYHVNVTNLDDANNYVWSVPVPEPIVASTDDCETADSLYTVSIVQNTGAISDTDDFKIRAFGNNDVKLSYSCEVWDDDTGTASATFPTSYGLRKIFFLVKSDDVDDAAITIMHPVWHNSTYCDGSDDEDCENNAWDEDYEPFGCYQSPSFSIPNFGWDRCSSELGLEDDDTWVASDSGDTCTQVGENADSLCGVDGTSDADDFDDDEIVPAYDACVKACCDYVPALDTQTRRRRRRSLAALADDAKMRKWLKRDARAAPAAIRETSTTTIIHESRREHVVATAAAAVVLVASLAFVYLSQRKQTATLAKLEQRLDQVLKLQGRDGAPPRGL